MFASRTGVCRVLAALVLAVVLIQPRPASSEPVLLDFLGTDDFQLSLSYDSLAAPTSVFPRLTGPLTIPGTAIYPVESSALRLGSSFFSNAITATQIISRGILDPDFVSLPDTFEFITTFQFGTDVITAAIQIFDPTLRMAANVLTDTIFINDQQVELVSSRPFTDVQLFQIGLATGGGFFSVQSNGQVVTGLITAIVDRTQQVISEPSSLILAIVGFALLGFLARLGRQAR